MNWDQAKGQWKQLKGKALEQWGKLTDDDLDVIDGKREQLAALQLHRRLGDVQGHLDREGAVLKH